MRLFSSQVLEDAGTGLILNERVVNSPPQIAPPLMQALFDEIGWAVEDQPTKVETASPNAHCIPSRDADVAARCTV